MAIQLDQAQYDYALDIAVAAGVPVSAVIGFAESMVDLDMVPRELAAYDAYTAALGEAHSELAPMVERPGAYRGKHRK